MKPVARRVAVGGDNSVPLSRKIYNIISERIITFQLKPFDSLSEVSLAEELGVSRTPTREALLRLSDIGLVEIFPQRGTFISPLRMQDLQKSQFLREALEVALLHRAFARRELTNLAARMQAEISVQRTYAGLNDMVQFYASDERFHSLIASAAGLEQMLPELDRAKVHMDRFRQLLVTGIEDIEAIIAQHQRLVDAISADDLDSAESALVAHLQRVLQFSEAAKAKYPDYFVNDPPPTHTRIT